MKPKSHEFRIHFGENENGRLRWNLYRQMTADSRFVYLGVSDQGDADAQFPLLTSAEFSCSRVAFIDQVDVHQRLLNLFFYLVTWHALIPIIASWFNWLVFNDSISAQISSRHCFCFFFNDPFEPLQIRAVRVSFPTYADFSEEG